MGTSRFIWVFGIACLVFGLVIRLYHFQSPLFLVFDERHFVNNALNYLHRAPDWNDHPPLGKFLIAIGIYFFGDNSFGWRVVPVLFGLGNICLVAIIAKTLFKENTYAIMAASFFAIDGMMIVYSKLAQLEGIILGFSLAAFLSALLMKKIWQTVLTGILVGLAVSVKWNALAVMVPVLFMSWQKRMLGRMAAVLMTVSVSVYCAVVFAGLWVSQLPHSWSSIWQWNKDIWIHHQQLTDWTHPALSKWWTWPFLKKPIVILSQMLDGDGILFLSSIGNPLLWWGASVTAGVAFLLLVGQLFRNQQRLLRHPVFPLLLGWAAFLFPWALTSRDTYIYHYFPAYGFAILIFSSGLTRLVVSCSRIFRVITLSIFAISLLFTPIWVGIPLPKNWLPYFVWFKTWG